MILYCVYYLSKFNCSFKTTKERKVGYEMIASGDAAEFEENGVRYFKTV